MKIGFNLLLWTGHVTEENFPILEKLKATGYHGVEIPIFDPGDPSHYARIGQALKDNGLASCAVTVCPDQARSLISPNEADRRAGVDHLKRVIECGHQAGIENICGPYYQELGNFTGKRPHRHRARPRRRMPPRTRRSRPAGRHPPYDRGAEPIRMPFPQHHGTGQGLREAGESPELRHHV
jgi:sugar phosphate isomerase/epimerase